MKRAFASPALVTHARAGGRAICGEFRSPGCADSETGDHQDRDGERDRKRRGIASRFLDRWDPLEPPAVVPPGEVAQPEKTEIGVIEAADRVGATDLTERIGVHREAGSPLHESRVVVLARNVVPDLTPVPLNTLQPIFDVEVLLVGRLRVWIDDALRLPGRPKDATRRAVSPPSTCCRRAISREPGLVIPGIATS